MNKKETLLALLKILERYTDSEHPLSRKQIIHYMQENYHIEVDRKTFSRHLNTLIDFEYDIKGPIRHNNEYCYYLDEHLFEKYEAHLITNTIYHSHYLSAKASNDLIKKIFSTLSIYDEKELRQVSGFHDKKQPFKNNSQQFFLNIEVILEAIRKHSAITFHYLKYGLNKKLQSNRSEPYIVKPYAVICSNDNIYLIAGSNERNSIVHFRVEKMKNVELFKTDQAFPTLSEAPYQYIRNKMKMFHGEGHHYTLKCDNRILDYVIEECGNEVNIQPCDDQHFYAFIHGTKEGMIYFILQYIRYIEVLEPSDFRQEIRDILEKAYVNHK